MVFSTVIYAQNLEFTALSHLWNCIRGIILFFKALEWFLIIITKKKVSLSSLHRSMHVLDTTDISTFNIFTFTYYTSVNLNFIVSLRHTSSLLSSGFCTTCSLRPECFAPDVHIVDSFRLCRHQIVTSARRPCLKTKSTLSAPSHIVYRLSFCFLF